MAKDNTCYFVILGILSLRPGSGYDIKKTIESGIGYFYKVSNGQIYPILKKLLNESAVIYTLERNDGKPDKKTYTITQRGLEVFRKWLELPNFNKEEDLLLRLYFGSMEPTKHNVALLNRITEIKEKNLAAYNHIAEKFDLTSRTYLPNVYSYFTLRYGQIIAQATIDWSKEVIGALKELEHE